MTIVPFIAPVLISAGAKLAWKLASPLVKGLFNKTGAAADAAKAAPAEGARETFSATLDGEVARRGSTESAPAAPVNAALPFGIHPAAMTQPAGASGMPPAGKIAAVYRHFDLAPHQAP